ncbi:hypothetical protein RB595_010335 [Gaeumannomyces hyphopodioides]
MDPFSITAGVVGIAAPTLHCVKQLMNDIQNIVDAPDAVKSLTKDLGSVGLALASVEAIPSPQWKSLGEPVARQSEAAISSCRDSCQRFKTSLDHWTRHSKDGTLSWRDRAVLGVCRQGHVKSISDQLRNCQVTLSSVVNIATLHASLQQTQTAEAIQTTISTKETAIADALAAMDEQLSQMGAKLVALCLSRPTEGDTEVDKASATSQVAMEQKAMGESRQVLEELLSVVQAAAASAGKSQGITVTFGSHNSGQQIGTSYGSIVFNAKA